MDVITGPGRGWFYKRKLKRIVKEQQRREESETGPSDFKKRVYLVRDKSLSRAARMAGCPSVDVMELWSNYPHRKGDEVGVGLVVVEYRRDAPIHR